MQRFVPALGSHGFVEVDDVRLGPVLLPTADFYFVYGRRPLQTADVALRRTSGVIDGLSSFHLRVGFAFTNWAEIDLSIPFLQIIQKGQSFGSYSDADASDASSGDLWIAGRFRILPEEKFIGIGVVPFVTLPLGGQAQFTTSGVPTFGIKALFSRRWGFFHWAANFGYRFKPAGQIVGESVAADDEILFSAGAGITPVRNLLDINLELVGAGIVGEGRDSSPDYQSKTVAHTPVELLLSGRLMTPVGLDVVVGGAVGLSGGVGTPSFRAFAGVGFAPVNDKDRDGVVDKKDKCPVAAEDRDGYADADGCPEPDNDLDGFLDADDACPTEAEDKDGFEDEDGCPEPDNDGDEILDEQDRCPDEAEDRDNHRDQDGCPEPDNDYDKILDKDDHCPLQKEDYDGFADTDGCPDLDNDEDGVLDLDDYCPLEAEDKNDVMDHDGCPESLKVVLRNDRIHITERVNFSSGGASIEKQSFDLLDAVASKLAEHPEIEKVRIEGHTDEVAEASFNRKLSERRAQAVRNYLIKKGISYKRLEAVGLGESQPWRDNATEEGRAMNRRVEFKIVAP